MRFNLRLIASHVLAFALTLTPAFAQPSRLGVPAAMPGMAPDSPDIAYDSVNRVFLQVSGTQGRFSSADGVLLGPAAFTIATTFTLSMSIAYEPDERSFLATWVGGSDSTLYARRVSYIGGNQAAFTHPVQILATNAYFGIRPSVAYSQAQKEFLVAWMGDYEIDGNIWGRRVSGSGFPLGERFRITAIPGDWELDPAIAHSRATDEFMVAYSAYSVATGSWYVAVQAVAAGTQEVRGLPTVLQKDPYIRTPAIEYNAADGLFAVAWYASSGTMAATLNDAGGMISNVRSVAAGATVPGVDIAINPLTGTFLVVSRTPTRTLATELTRHGAPTSGPIVVMDLESASEPRVAANARAARWMVMNGALGPTQLQAFRQEIQTATAPALFPGAALTHLTPNPAPPYFSVTLPPSVTWTVGAVAGGPLVEYQFFVFDESTGAWTLVQPYSPDSTVLWSAPSGGRYALQVWARSVGSTASYESYLGSGVFDVESMNVQRASVSMPAGPYQTGNPITFTARASGGRGPIQYKFDVVNDSGTLAYQEWSASNTFTWTPLSAATGLRVVVEASGAGYAFAPVRAETTVFDVTAGPVKAHALVPFKSLPTSPGRPLLFRAVVSGPSNLQCKFLLFTAATNTWSVLQDYGFFQSVLWTPTTAGKYALQVWVRATGSTAQYEAWAGTGMFDIANTPVQVRSLVANQSFPVPMGTSVTFAADAAGGSGELEYRFLLYTPSSGWVVYQEYSSFNTFTYQPTEGFVNAVQVWVRTVGSTAAYEAYAGTGYFVITP